MKTLTDLAKLMDKDVDTLENLVNATQAQLDKVKLHIACLRGFAPTIENFEQDLLAKGAISYPKAKPVKKATKKKAK